MAPSEFEPILLRRFVDAASVPWTVWEVTPGYLAASVLRPYALHPGLANGWLAFESQGGDRRRLVPAPHGWFYESDHNLELLCERAEPVGARDLSAPAQTAR